MKEIIADIESGEYGKVTKASVRLAELIAGDEKKTGDALAALGTRHLLVALHALSNPYLFGDEPVFRVATRLSRTAYVRLQHKEVEADCFTPAGGWGIPLDSSLVLDNERCVSFVCGPEDGPSDVRHGADLVAAYREKMGELFADMPLACRTGGGVPTRIVDCQFLIPPIPGISRREMFTVVRNRLDLGGVATPWLPEKAREAPSDADARALLEKAAGGGFMRMSETEGLLAALRADGEFAQKFLKGAGTAERISVLRALRLYYDLEDPAAAFLVAEFAPRILDSLRKNPVAVELEVDPAGGLSGKVFHEWHYPVQGPENPNTYFLCYAEGSGGNNDDVTRLLKELFADMRIRAACSEMMHQIPTIPGISSRDLWLIAKERLGRSGSVWKGNFLGH